MKIDRRKSYYMTLDTETTNGFDDPIVYDIGGAIHDKQGNVYETFSFVIYETFVGMADLMETAYYAEKIPMYREQIRKGERKMVRYATAKNVIAELCNKYNVKAIIAHNARFDYRSTATTQRYLTKSASRYFLPYGVPVWDTLEMAKSVIKDKPTYRNFCEKNGYIVRGKQVRLTAEILYRFISGQEDFEEEHTGLADVLIEKEIFTYCMRQHKKMKKSPWAE